MAEKKSTLGPTGQTVASNVARLRGRMQYKELSEKLSAIGRPIPALGLRRIEGEERRVDADDLVALSIIFGVSPITLLMPSTENPEDHNAVTGATREFRADEIWRWLRTELPLGLDLRAVMENLEFQWRSKPSWSKAEIGSGPDRDPAALRDLADALERATDGDS